MFTNEIEQTLDHFRRSFDRFFEGSYTPSRQIGSADGTEWVFTPTVETGWTSDHLYLRVVLPGVTERDMNLTIQGNQLWIRGERQAPEYVQKNGTFYRGLTYGKFERIVDLPGGLDLDKMEANLHEGVLDIRIPLAAAMKPKTVRIATGEPRHVLAA
jgi:HSP20 family protein